jgi:hypothetical protein
LSFPRALFIYLFFFSGLGAGSGDRKFHWESSFLFLFFFRTLFFSSLNGLTGGPSQAATADGQIPPVSYCRWF